MDLRKPDNTKVIAIIFYGRKSRVEILRCFLERNLVDNGGWLDEVHWVRNTKNQSDLRYLEEILTSNERYKKITLPDEIIGPNGFTYAWGCLERGNIYVKIDDDVVWLADDTIPRIVNAKLSNPQCAVTSANVVNSPLMGWVHYRMGAILPYLPEFESREAPTTDLLDISKKTPWQYHKYPSWQGPKDYVFTLDQDPPYNGHRWLRLENDFDIHRTPVAQIEYDTWGTGLSSWAIAAQQHYSFLENLAENRLDRYKFGKLWITDYQRLSINCICISADDVLDNLPVVGVDETWLTVHLPKKLGKSVAVVTDALAVHFTFGPQVKMDATDLLARYHDYAVVNSCPKQI